MVSVTPLKNFRPKFISEIENEKTEHLTGNETYRRHTKEVRNRMNVSLYHLTEEELEYFEVDNSTRRMQDTMTFEGEGLKNTSRKSYRSEKDKKENSGKEVNTLNFETSDLNSRSTKGNKKHPFNKKYQQLT